MTRSWCDPTRSWHISLAPCCLPSHLFPWVTCKYSDSQCLLFHKSNVFLSKGIHIVNVNYLCFLYTHEKEVKDYSVRPFFYLCRLVWTHFCLDIGFTYLANGCITMRRRRPLTSRSNYQGFWHGVLYGPFFFSFNIWLTIFGTWMYHHETMCHFTFLFPIQCSPLTLRSH